MLYILILSVIINLALIVYIFMLNIEFSKIINQVKRLNKNEYSTIIKVNLISKKLEELVREVKILLNNFKLERAKVVNKNKDYQMIISSISHDIRTPLTSIKAYMQLISKNNEKLFGASEIVDDKSTAIKNQNIEYMKIVNRRILDLENLLNEFFYLSLLENDDYKIELQKIDILEILIDSLGEFYEVFESKGIEINADLVKSAYVLGDAISIKRVIDNLLKNLSKYCKRRADISLLREDNVVKLVIVDYLEECESIDTSEIFKFFYTMDKSRNSKSKGLGLYGARKLLDKMNGSISAICEDNKLIMQCVFKRIH